MLGMPQHATPWEETVQWVGVVAGCIIRKEGKYLLVQEKQQRAYGLWNIPAGHVDRGEDLATAAIREVREETGYDVQLGKEIAVIHESANVSVKHVYEATIVGGSLKPDTDEIMQVAWLTFDEITQLHQQQKIRKPWVFEVLLGVET